MVARTNGSWVVYAGEQGEWPAQGPILSIMVGPFLPGEHLPYAACQCNGEARRGGGSFWSMHVQMKQCQLAVARSSSRREATMQFSNGGAYTDLTHCLRHSKGCKSLYQYAHRTFRIPDDHKSKVLYRHYASCRTSQVANVKL